MGGQWSVGAKPGWKRSAGLDSPRLFSGRSGEQGREPTGLTLKGSTHSW